MSLEAPGELVIYNDEVTPGRQLGGPNMRKHYCIYWSLCDFGLRILSQEVSWFTVAVVRSSEVDKLEGGISYVITRILASLFFDRTGYHAMRAGVNLELAPDCDPKHIF